MPCCQKTALCHWRVKAFRIHWMKTHTNMPFPYQKILNIHYAKQLNCLEMKQSGRGGVKELAGKEDQLTRECLRYMYRLLFLFYIESRPELGYASMNNEIYLKGYSLEHLRDLVEAPPPQTGEERMGRFFHDSLTLLFRLIEKGHTPAGANPHVTGKVVHNNFYMEPLFNHLFDSEMTPLLNSVVFPNHVLFRVIELMSLSRPKKRKHSRRGRISYVQLGINQLGAVYEGLLSYRGFIAHEDLYEVQRAEDAKDHDDLAQAMFVMEKELSNYDKKKEIVTEEDGRFKVYPKGSFIYRLAGRDRQKSASYYTPEVLTRTLVKYALKELIKDKSAVEILDIHVCEPTMGSAVFLNEAINQLADLYLRKRQEELGKSIPHEQYSQEKQTVKMLLADRNVFGVDLNPIAVELGEVSLWLNTMVRGGFVLWFGLQLRCGNSLVGAQRAVFKMEQLEKRSTAP